MFILFIINICIIYTKICSKEKNKCIYIYKVHVYILSKYKGIFCPKLQQKTEIFLRIFIHCDNWILTSN